MKKLNVVIVYNPDESQVLMCKRSKEPYKGMMNFQYFISGLELEVFAGKLFKEVILKEEVNSLFWVDRNENFCDMNRFAGECNIEHMLQQVDYYKNRIFKEKDRL